MQVASGPCIREVAISVLKGPLESLEEIMFFCIAVKEAKIGMVTHTCNASTHKTEARGLP